MDWLKVCGDKSKPRLEPFIDALIGADHAMTIHCSIVVYCAAVMILLWCGDRLVQIFVRGTF